MNVTADTGLVLSAPAPVGARVLGFLTDAWQPQRLSTHVASVPAFTLVVVVGWLLGTWLDAVTTWLMMNAGFVEGNPVAAAGMGVVGVGTYIVLTVLVGVGFSLLAACVGGRSATAVAVQGSLLLWMLVKVTVAGNNVGIWMGLPPVPGLG